MNPFTGSLIVVSAFMLGAFVPKLGEGHGWPVLNEFLPALAVLVAAYVGAREAFHLDRLKEREKEMRSRLRAGNFALVTLARQLNRITNIRTQLVDPVRNDDHAFLKMHPPAFQLPMPAIRFDEIGFLVESEDPNILGTLSTAQDTAFSAVNTIAERARIFLQEVQPRLEAAEFQAGDVYPEQHFRDVIGPRLMAALEQGTQSAIEFTDLAESNLMEQAGLLTGVLKRMFPGERVAALEIPKASPVT